MKKIDLHGLRHNEIKWVLISKIESLWDSNTELEIITGYSDHMKSTVTEILDEYKLEYKIGDTLGVNMGFIKTII